MKSSQSIGKSSYLGAALRPSFFELAVSFKVDGCHGFFIVIIKLLGPRTSSSSSSSSSLLKDFLPKMLLYGEEWPDLGESLASLLEGDLCMSHIFNAVRMIMDSAKGKFGISAYFREF